MCVSVRGQNISAVVTPIGVNVCTTVDDLSSGQVFFPFDGDIFRGSPNRGSKCFWTIFLRRSFVGLRRKQLYTDARVAVLFISGYSTYAAIYSTAFFELFQFITTVYLLLPNEISDLLFMVPTESSAHVR